MRKSLVLTSAALAVSFLAAPVMAQGMDDAVAAARNQLGLLEYCQAEGHIDGTAVETQTKMMAMLPAATDTTKGDEAYAKGKAGMLSVGGVEQDLTQLESQGGNVADVCKQMADALATAAGQMGG
ncbi:pore-forming ESAT-6 family protein [Pseudogemmobacter bohemicus]|uniref:pore-forming ESAT-6 family protein n=1 Tax=Pseudogemmobacter bohemicus TaxID=2250708 RepID=UPI0018E4E76C|nr:pore-forming ESAT-6 family protein [Pseudogemmobacter bohemicus]